VCVDKNRQELNFSYKKMNFIDLQPKNPTNVNFSDEKFTMFGAF
jgi:hypothetical protein